MKTVTLICAVAALSACATAPATAPAYASSDTSFTGWARFSEGEFQLYADEDQIRRPFSRPCLSGAASRDVMRMSGDLSNAKVRVTGRTAPWSQAANARIEHAGSVIRNVCGGDFVVLADAIQPAN